MPDKTELPEWAVKEAKEIVGAWGYEESYWWKPIAQALAKARAEERERITNIIDGTNCDMCGQENTMWNCRTDRMEVCNGAKHELLRNLKEE